MLQVKHLEKAIYYPYVYVMNYSTSQDFGGGCGVTLIILPILTPCSEWLTSKNLQTRGLKKFKEPFCMQLKGSSSQSNLRNPCRSSLFLVLEDCEVVQHCARAALSDRSLSPLPGWGSPMGKRGPITDISRLSLKSVYMIYVCIYLYIRYIYTY